ncbi:ATP-binding protein [Streptomyces sp. M10(2022)]
MDEEVHRLHGRYGVDYPEREYFEREAPVIDAVRASSWHTSRPVSPSSSTTDCGVAPTATHGKDGPAAGGRPLLVYLPASKETLLRRLVARNERQDANALTVTPQALDDFFARFEPPSADEDAVRYNGDPEIIRSMVQ